MRKFWRLFLLLSAGVLLLLVRLFEKNIFDDGLIDFFAYQYQTQNLPEISFWHSLFIDGLRYWVNSLISITLLFLLFKQKKLLQFLFILYLSAFFIITILFYIEWHHYEAGKYVHLFYVRRFLIQPILLFILIPGFIYHKSKTEGRF